MVVGAGTVAVDKVVGAGAEELLSALTSATLATVSTVPRDSSVLFSELGEPVLGGATAGVELGGAGVLLVGDDGAVAPPVESLGVDVEPARHRLAVE